ncbi:spore coat protein YsxE [Bacillus sp. T33-2]|uniref:spore coat protein YsxE n=1 Tax=Bacillus sp. T33-2 TaxID=2054168 RepID=UPI000C782A80|nr:spore coat protein YsxE [Bacillus sp. T33-2]PLR93700.1 spore coat protein YsxE [Bacillus sp. T33-2]
MEDLKQNKETVGILRSYGIKPRYIEAVGKINKVYADTGIYALKKIQPNKGTDFMRHIQFLYQKGYNRIVPVFPTSDGRYAVLENQSLFYLMPWLSNEEKENRMERHRQMFRELARLHTLSAREIEINKEDRLEHYEKTLRHWEKEEEFLEGFIESCENNWYMSPFELLFCQYYNNIRQAMDFSKQKLENWHEKTKDQQKSRMVVVHGKVSTEHFVYDEKGYGFFINFEEARLGSPIHDLLPFLVRSLNTLPKRAYDCVEWISTYFKYFPLKEEERSLFLSYLAHPTSILKIAEMYHQKQSGKDEQKLVQKLQREFWTLKNTEYVVMKTEEIEAQKKMAQQEGAQE